METAETIWTQSLKSVKERLGQKEFERWFSNVVLGRVEEGRIVVEAPLAYQADWIRTNYLPLLRQTWSDATSSEIEIEIHSNGNGHGDTNVPTESLLSKQQKQMDDRPVGQHTFENFVVGNSNQFAYASALAVATEPGRKYNPLLLYGGVGLGKTHLIHAVGSHLGRERALTIHMTTSQSFEQDFISHVRNRALDDFRAKYKKVDVLLIDDIHFWARKEQTQQEFYFVFNTLFERRKQMVFTSDRPPNEIPDLDERLVSRFSMGHMADIQPPDIETKVAILQKKSEQFGVQLPDDVAFFLSGRINSNIRDLEGCLTRLAAHLEFTQQDLCLDYVKTNIDTILPGRKEKPTSDEIIRTVIQHFNIKLTDIKGQRRIKSIAYARQVAMYLLRTILGTSLPEIGMQFGGRDHSTVLHACRKIHGISTTDDRTKKDLHDIRKAFGYA
ncbi:MAG: chromosomal replication initiator protein DnaA [Nitrospirae bacterium]|nr:chromosomal replication initiator protein DnaA [Nitrospirota bacterium]